MRSIDEVIADLDAVIARQRARRSRLGYFPALYRRVTVAVRDRIAAGGFEDGARMERLDVIFADRYLDALRAHERGARPTRAWAYAFMLADARHPTILQHLLLGINAHINLDLGIAAAQCAPDAEIGALAADFDAINGLLAAMVDDVQRQIGALSPLMGLLESAAGELDERLVDFSLERARRAAWRKALALAPLSESRRHARILTYDRRARALALAICPPRTHLSPTMARIRAAESDDIVRVIDTLAGG